MVLNAIICNLNGVLVMQSQARGPYAIDQELVCMRTRGNSQRDGEISRMRRGWAHAMVQMGVKGCDENDIATLMMGVRPDERSGHVSICLGGGGILQRCLKPVRLRWRRKRDLCFATIAQ